MANQPNPLPNGSGQLPNPAAGGSQSAAANYLNRSDICRDFLNHICRRGKRCKFFHPEELEESEDPYHFCIDFQNRGCVREHCRFIHAPEELVNEYKRTREITLPLARAIVAVSSTDTIAGIPLCGEFQDGVCARADCRYWHINADEERARRDGQSQAVNVPVYAANHGYGVGVKRPGGYLDAPYEKMPRMDGYRMPCPPDRVLDLERNNAELRKEVDMLRFQLQNERERYQDLYSLFRQLACTGSLRLTPQTPQEKSASESFPPAPPPLPAGMRVLHNW